MNQNNTIKEQLINLVPRFSTLAVECIELLCGITCGIKQPWKVVSRIEGTFDHNFSLGNANKDFQGLLNIGIMNDSVALFIDNYADDLELCDFFGELANTYCGMLMDYNEFTDYFGCLTQSTPQHNLHQIHFPQVWGISGLVHHEDKWLAMGYAIRENSLDSLSIKWLVNSDSKTQKEV